MATSGTNITAIAKPGVGTTAGPEWATNLNTSLDAVISTGETDLVVPSKLRLAQQ